MNDDYRRAIQAFHAEIARARSLGRFSSLRVHVGDSVETALRDLDPGMGVLQLRSGAESAHSSPEEAPFLSVSLTEDDFYADKVAMAVSEFKVERVKLVVEPVMERDWREVIVTVKESVEIAVQNLAVLRATRLLTLRNALRNIPVLMRDQRVPAPKVNSGWAAVVCGAGPSLHSQLDDLKKVDENVVVIAVGHAVKTLLAANVNVDFAVELDPQCFLNWEGATSVDCDLVASVGVSPSVTRLFNRVHWGCCALLSVNHALRKSGFRLTHYESGPSVSVTAIDFARQLGCSRVALIGQELCVDERGELHAGEGAFSADSDLNPLPGNDVDTVWAPPNFINIHHNLEAYAGRLRSDDAFELCNCTRGGAKISHAKRVCFTEFLKSYCQSGSKFQNMSLGQGMEGFQDFEKLFEITRRLLKGNERLRSVSERLRKELEREPMRMSDVRRLQEELIRLDVELDDAVSADFARRWFQPAFDHVDDVVFAGFSCLSGMDADGQLEALSVRARLTRDLFSDLRSDFEAIAPFVGETLAPSPDDAVSRTSNPLKFELFRNEAIALTRRSNPEFAHLLEKRCFPAPERFEIRPHFQELAFVCVKTSTGSRKLSELVMMKMKAAEDIRSFTGEVSYDEDRDVICMLAPANWIYVSQFSKLYPAADLLVIEPWPELFSHLIDIGSVATGISRKTIVVAIDERLPWRNMIDQVLRKWREAGKRILQFDHPYASALPEIQTLRKRLLPS